MNFFELTRHSRNIDKSDNIYIQAHFLLNKNATKATNNIKVLDSLKPYLSTISCNYNNRNKTAKFAVAVSPQSLKMQKIMEKCGHRQFKNLDIKAEIDNVTDNFFKILAD